MVIYPDTSFLFSLFVEEETSEMAEQIAGDLSEPLPFTPFHRLELRTAFRLRAFRKQLEPAELRSVLRRSDESLIGGVLQHVPLHWSDALREAERLGEAHLTEVGARSGDLLHVACAVVLGARDFLTFDQRQNALARRAGLKVKRWRR